MISYKQGLLQPKLLLFLQELSAIKLTFLQVR